MKRRVSIYQVYPRVYGENGLLKDVTKDLDRIASMGFDFLYLLPIHPIGKEGRKGSLGSPYSIVDYTLFNPELGTLEDFKELIEKAHDKGLKVMMDIVLNHTANDATWVKTHPEYYFLDENGKVARKMAEWSDISDLDYSNKELRKELVDMLVYWATLGVDGYRCDVASAVPLDFWKEADVAVKAVNPDFYWLAETTHMEFIQATRRMGYKPTTDAEMAQVFDSLYPYDFVHSFEKALGEGELSLYSYMLNFTYSEYPSDSSKLMYLENHDQPRIAHWVKGNKTREMNWLAFSFCYDGTAFVYAGQEAWATKFPSLFEREAVDWSLLDKEYEKEILNLNNFRRETLNNVIDCEVVGKEALELTLFMKNRKMVGLFDVNDVKKSVKTSLKDGTYVNVLNNKEVVVKDSEVDVANCPFMVEA